MSVKKQSKEAEYWAKIVSSFVIWLVLAVVAGVLVWRQIGGVPSLVIPVEKVSINVSQVEQLQASLEQRRRKTPVRVEIDPFVGL